MSDYNMDVVPGARAPVLSSALLTLIHRLNFDYVELLAQRPQPADAIAGETLPPRVLDALAGLRPEARLALAECPFALFSFGFDDRRFWNAVLDDSPGSGECAATRYGTSSVTSPQAGFDEVALFAAWHIASSRRIAARFLFGMPDEIATRLGRAPLWRLRRTAIDYPGLLTARWPSNPAFWPDLVRFAAVNDLARLETARLLGNQLMAAELDLDLPRRPRSRLGLRRQAGE